MALLFSPRLRRGLWLLCGLAGVHLVELIRYGHPVAAASLLGAALASVWAGRVFRRPGPLQARRLVVAADGRLFLQLHGGAVEEAVLCAASLRLGGSLLLVLRCGKSCHRVLLGPDTLAPDDLATLQRRLPRGGGV